MIFKDPQEAYQAIDDRLRERIQSDDALAVDMAKLSDEDLMDVRERWTDQQRDAIKIETVPENVEQRSIGGRGGLIPPSTLPIRQKAQHRPLYDQGTEAFLQAWREEPAIMDWSGASQEELEGAASLLMQAYPGREEEILRPAQRRAREILEERGQLFEDSEDDLRKVFTEEFTRRFAAFAEGAGGGRVMDLIRYTMASPQAPTGGRGFPMEGPQEERSRAAHDTLNKMSSMSPENRRLFSLAYGNDTALLKMAGTGLAWMGGANAVFRGNIRGGDLVPARGRDGLSRVRADGTPIMRRDLSFAIEPFSRKGLAVGVGVDAAAGALFGPEYAPSVVAEAFGLEPSALTSAVESGAIGLAAGTLLRALGNQAILTRVRNMPGMEDLTHMKDAEFMRAAVRRYEEMWEAARRQHAADASRSARPRETSSMGAEFVDDVPVSASRASPEGLPAAPAGRAGPSVAEPPPARSGPPAGDVRDPSGSNLLPQQPAKGKPARVRDIDPDTEVVIVDDGPRFGTKIEFPPGYVVHPDKGSLKPAPDSPAGKQSGAAKQVEAEVHHGSSFAASEPRAGAAQPDWVKQGGETRAGQTMIQGIERPKKKPEFGPRAIIDFVNDAVNVEMRRSRSQTSKRHPAHYRPVGHVVFTRRGMNQINFHEAGHGLKELIEARQPGMFDQSPLKEQLLDLTARPGSMASARNTHEGVAEWMRLRVVNPASVEGSPVTAAIEGAIRKYLPGVDAAVRDAARAWERFQRMPATQRWRMLNRDLREAGTFRLANILDTLGWASDRVMSALASGAPLSAIDRRIFRSIKANRQEMDLTYKAALRVARNTREKTQRIQQAHNNILSISSEVQNAMAGTGAMKGLRVIGDSGNFRIMSEETWREIMQKVPGKQWDQFQHAGWARESLNRWEKARLEYTGQRDGMKPSDLQAIVDQARREIPNFDEAFASVQRYFDGLLDIKNEGGLKGLGEVEKMRARGEYWPLPRVMWGGGGAPASVRTRSDGHMQSGDFRAKGSSEAIRDLTEVAEQRTRDALEGYYWNQLGLRMQSNLRDIATDKQLPMETRAIAGRVLQPLKMETKVAATLSREEGLQLVYDGLIDTMAERLGVSAQALRQEILIEDINLAWDFKEIWRPTAPKDYNVISLLHRGERQFYQVEDPMLFHYFANTDQPNSFFKAMEWLLLPSVQNWKRAITTSIEFATLRNLMGDLFNQVALNQGMISWVPGGATTLGIWNKFTKKYPQVFDKGLLLSRAEPTSLELVNQMRHGAPYRFITEGLYVSRHPNRLVRWTSTALQPANLLYPFFKTADLYNLMTTGRFVAPFLEGATREGAAVYEKMRGATDEAARDAYWRATGRFNEHPGLASWRTLSQTPGFFNPMVQALRGIGRNLTDPDPAVSGPTWFKLLAYVPAIFGTAAAARYLTMTEEEKERERERPIEQRTNYYDVHGFQLRFPLGIEGAMGSLAYNSVMDHLLERESLSGQNEARLYINRIVSWDMMSFMGPQVKAANEAQSNWSKFFQRNIVSPWMMGLPASEQYSLDTPEFYRKLGRWFNYSPDKIQYLVRSGVARQADDVIELLNRIEQGRPIQENADLPFVGRLFIRDPIGFGAQSVRDVSAIEERIHLLELRLQAKGWSQIEQWPADILTPETRALQTQIEHLRLLRWGAGQLQTFSQMARTHRELGNYVEEQNMKRAMVEFSQRLLLHNREQAEEISEALKMVDAMPMAPPEHRQMDIIQRRLGQ